MLRLLFLVAALVFLGAVIGLMVYLILKLRAGRTTFTSTLFEASGNIMYPSDLSKSEFDEVRAELSPEMIYLSAPFERSVKHNTESPPIGSAKSHTKYHAGNETPLGESSSA